MKTPLGFLSEAYSRNRRWLAYMQRESGWQVRACITEGIHPEKSRENDEERPRCGDTKTDLTADQRVFTRIFWPRQLEFRKPQAPCGHSDFRFYYGLANSWLAVYRVANEEGSRPQTALIPMYSPGVGTHFRVSSTRQPP
jgi:hypothetical protein